jgi:GNAT superfamily N-acetyltransferase
LLLDAHASGMALGLAAPLTHEAARAAWLATASRLEPGERLQLAALDGDCLVGAVHLSRAGAGNARHRGEIQRLAVRADARGRGVGRLLMDAVVARAHSLGFRLLWLTTHADTDADRIYEHLGWTRAGVIPDYSLLPSGELTANSFFYLRLESS